MSITGLILSLIITGIIFLIVVYPFVRPHQQTVDLALQQQYDRIQAYYERVLTNIHDLDEDHATGKINETDYNEEREVWVYRGIRLLRVQDQLDREHSLVTSDHLEMSDIDAAIEEAILAYRDGSDPDYHELSKAETTGS